MDLVRHHSSWQQNISPKTTRNKAPPKISGDALIEDVKTFPDDFNYERARRLNCSKTGIFNALKRLGISQKRTLAHQQITESGKRIYNEEHQNKILEQLNVLLATGHNLTMVKKALAVYHNINMGTLDKWRKSAKDGSDNSTTGSNELGSNEPEYIRAL